MQLSDHIGEVAIGAVVAVMSWLGKRQVERIDKLETDKADKQDIRDLLEQVTERLDKVADASVQTSLAVARIEGQLAQRQ